MNTSPHRNYNLKRFSKVRTESPSRMAIHRKKLLPWIHYLNMRKVASTDHFGPWKLQNP